MIRNLVCFDEGEKEHHFWVNKSTVCVNHRLSSVVMYFVATVRITGIQDERQPEPIMLTEGAEWDIFLDTVSLDYSLFFSLTFYQLWVWPSEVSCVTAFLRMFTFNPGSAWLSFTLTSEICIRSFLSNCLDRYWTHFLSLQDLLDYWVSTAMFVTKFHLILSFTVRCLSGYD